MHRRKMVVSMLTIPVFCVAVLFITTDVQSRYVFESSIRGSIETNKIISSFEDAASQCKTEGAVLAAPVNEQLRDKMIALIGVKNHSTPYFINAKLVHSHKPQFVSSEGVSLDDMSVSDMIEELDPRDGECLAMDSRTIRVVSCSAPLPYMCYKENDITTPVTVPVAGPTVTEQVNIQTSTERVVTDCGTNDTEYELLESTGSCYKHHRLDKTWDEANSICTAEGGYLVILNDENEAIAVYRRFFLANRYATFIGLRDFNNTETWTSVHGDDVNSLFHVWDDDHNSDKSLNCASLDYTCKLAEFDCEAAFTFVCEKDPRTRNTGPEPSSVSPESASVRTLIATNSSTAESTVCGTTGEGYKPVESTGSCYKLHRDEKTWDEANAICTAEDGHLVVINDETEAGIIHEHFFPKRESDTYIGLQDYEGNNVWTSVLGDSIDSIYNVWYDRRVYHHEATCATLDYEGKLNDYPCSTAWTFVCEKKLQNKNATKPGSATV
ncbi:secretory phospholipase A2 receptor-like [Anticarsia gemmatalis]|uniref:secretory phospholipase A2 receptor-like n=1 Tax=Anticarsia gemmatalis TaxID=129554 RepID=UPI003F76F3FA